MAHYKPVYKGDEEESGAWETGISQANIQLSHKGGVCRALSKAAAAAAEPKV